MFGEKLHYESQFKPYCNSATMLYYVINIVIISCGFWQTPPLLCSMCVRVLLDELSSFFLLFSLEGVAAIEEVHQVLPSGYWWSLLYGTVLLFLCFIVCLVRVKFFFFVVVVFLLFYKLNSHLRESFSHLEKQSFK